MSADKNNILDNYRSPGLIERIKTAFQKAGKPLTELTLADLEPLDEFHIRGAQATQEIIDLLAATPQMHVFDAGCGLGGPARRIAAASGCRVSGIDLTDDYCIAGNEISAWLGLASQVKLSVGNVTAMPKLQDRTFDAAYTIHVGMNIADKKEFYSEIKRIMKPGSTFLIYDVFTKDYRPLEYPLPWALDPNSSFLITIHELQALLSVYGFRITQTIEQTDAARTFLQNTPRNTSPVGLSLLTGQRSREKFANLFKNLSAGNLAVATILCRRV